MLSTATTVVSVAALVFWFVALRPLSLGGSANYTVIHGNSMYPLYKDGDLIITHRAADYTVGQVVAYTVPAGEVGAGHLVIHRIIGGDTERGLQLQGDNNPSVDPWHPRLADIAGTTWVQVPRAGRVLVLLHQPLTLALVVSLLTVLTVLLRKPRRPDGTEPEQAAPPLGGDLDEVRPATAGAAAVATLSTTALVMVVVVCFVHLAGLRRGD